ncbi:MAG TPA: HAD family phosphatase, partial [Kofleriaceae bacterium]|nr:HAD family phosphatase [Kofleriaceae bacterium]
DLGGVLIDWNPRHLYRKLCADESEMEDLLGRVCTSAWNQQQDAGRALAEATEELVAAHPEREQLIRAYYDRFDEMMVGEIEGTAAVVEELDRRGVPLYALSNFSAETFVHARRRFRFLDRFRAILLSGEERLVKPDPRFYRLLVERAAIRADEAVFIDDIADNVEGARAVGMIGVQFRNAPALRRELVQLRLL